MQGHEADDDRDPMGPPKEPCECWCLHCRRTFMSSDMWFQRVIGDPQGFPGFWMCPTPNCSGAGFCFDIFPTDADHPANAEWEEFDDEDEDEYDPEFDEDLDEAAEWDPDESKWKELDEVLGAGCGDDDDLEGEEWKHGLQPGERPPQPEFDDDERQYNEPDRRPREVDWSNRPDRNPHQGAGGEDDDIPF